MPRGCNLPAYQVYRLAGKNYDPHFEVENIVFDLFQHLGLRRFCCCDWLDVAEGPHEFRGIGPRILLPLLAFSPLAFQAFELPLSYLRWVAVPPARMLSTT